MKTTKKKLSLTKETVRTLNDRQLANVGGGLFYTVTNEDDFRPRTYGCPSLVK